MKNNYFNSFRWKRSWIIIALVLFTGTWFLFFDTYSLMTKFQLERQKNELIERTEQYQKQAEELDKKIDALNNDPDLIERIAREDYGMRKPDETVYKIQTIE